MVFESTETMDVPGGEVAGSPVVGQLMESFESLLNGPWRDHGLLALPAWYRPPAPKEGRPAELDYLRTRITFAELFGAEASWELLFERLRSIGLHSIVSSLSFANSVLHVKGVLQAQTEMVAGTFDSDLMDRVGRLPNWRGRIVYSPSQLLLVMKAAILYSPDREDERDNPAYRRALAEVLLMANDLLDAEVSKVVAAATQSDLDRALLSHSIRSTLANVTERYEYAMARASIVFTRIAVREDARHSPDFIDLEARFKALSGLTLRDYLAIGSALVSWFHHGVHRRDLEENRSIRPATFFGKTDLDPATAASILSGLTHTHESAKQAFTDRDGQGRLFAYDVVPFMQGPLYRIRENVSVPVSLAFLEGRVTNGVYWILFDSMDTTERLRLSRFYGQLVETYVREALLRALPDRPTLAQRVFPELVYGTSQGDRKTSDVVALYPDAAVFFEVTATRLRLDGTVLVDDPAAVEDDLEKTIVKKARQLDARIADFRQGRYQFGDVGTDQVKRILPVVVTGGSIPMWTTTATAIRRAVQNEGLLTATGIEPLRVIGIDELEMIEPLVAQGHDIFNILQAHAADHDLRNVSLRNFLIKRHAPIPANVSLIQEFRDMGKHAARVLFDEAEL